MAPFLQLKRLINSAVLLTPILPIFGSLGYEQVKVIGIIFLINLLGLVWLLGKPKLNFSSIQKIALIFILSLLLSSLLGLRPKESLLGVEPYYQGWLTYLYLFLLGWIVSSLKLNLKFQFFVWTIGGVMVGLTAIYQYLLMHFFNQFVPTYAGRVVSSFGQPNFYSGFLLLLLPFQIYLFKQKNYRAWIIVSLIITLSAIIISQSRVSISLAGLVILGWGFWSLKSRLFKTYLLIIGVVVFGFLSWQLVLNEVILPSDKFWSINNSPEKRLYLWRVLPEMILKQPILGYGLENISTIYQSYFQEYNFNVNQDPVKLSLKDITVDRTHNYFLDLLLFSGVIGTFSWFILVLVVIKKSYKTPLFLPILLYLVWISFQNQSIIQLLYFWWLIGISES